MPHTSGPTSLSQAGIENVTTQRRKRKKARAQAKGTDTSVASSAVGGAATGSAFGPVGALVGAGLGATAGAVGERGARKAAEAASGRPKRRRLGRITDTLRGQEQRKAAALASLSQAAFDLASRFR